MDAYSNHDKQLITEKLSARDDIKIIYRGVPKV